jgi:hypothetical protein
LPDAKSIGRSGRTHSPAALGAFDGLGARGVLSGVEARDEAVDADGSGSTAQFSFEL